MRSLFGIASVCAAGALALASAGFAGQPVTQILNPPPPPFETCKAIGNGTICQGPIDSSYGPVDTGLVCGSGPDGFGIADGATQRSLARRDYDSDGNLVRRFRNDRLEGQLSNETSGAAVPYTQTWIQTDELAVPGDLSSATTTWTGKQLILRPTTGAPVVIGAGRDLFAPDGSLEFQAGPSGFLDLLASSSSAIDPVCAALGVASP